MQMVTHNGEFEKVNERRKEKRTSERGSWVWDCGELREIYIERERGEEKEEEERESVRENYLSLYIDR